MFREVEEALDAAAPDRKVHVDWVADAGSEVCIEATLRLDPADVELDQPIAVHFTMNAERTRFVRDRTYVDSSLTAALGDGPRDADL